MTPNYNLSADTNKIELSIDKIVLQKIMVLTDPDHRFTDDELNKKGVENLAFSLDSSFSKKLVLKESTMLSEPDEAEDFKYPKGASVIYASDKEAKEKMMREMCEDAGFNISWLEGSMAHEIFDRLIRKGWRKVSHE